MSKLDSRITVTAGTVLPADPTTMCPHSIDPEDPDADLEYAHLESGMDVLVHRACGGIVPE